MKWFIHGWARQRPVALKDRVNSFHAKRFVTLPPAIVFTHSMPRDLLLCQVCQTQCFLFFCFLFLIRQYMGLLGKNFHVGHCLQIFLPSSFIPVRLIDNIGLVHFIGLLVILIGGRNSSVGSAWARCPQRRGFDPPLGTFSVEGIFPLELTWVQTPFPPKLLRMRV